MISATEYTKLKAAADKAAEAATRAEGAFDQALSQLKKEFNLTTLEEAKTKLEELRVEEQKAQERFEAKFEKFKEDYGHILTPKQAE